MDNFLRQTAAAAADHPDAQPPPTLEGYRTRRRLGVGSSACVWLVEDQRTGTSRALKVFVASTSRAGADPEEEKERIAQLHREIAVLDALKHPHLLGVRGVVSTDVGPAILMDYAGGGSLLNLVTARGRLSVGECITVLAPVAQALAYLHSASVQHGDVSPGNVLITAEGKPVLADLGVGRVLGEAKGHAGGTAGFTEPVPATALSAGFASDVYSVAAIGWYSLTGCPPGPTEDRVPLTLLVPDVPIELLHILEAALHDDPTERPTAGELADAVLHSAPPQPLDLVAAVHPSVLPELLTRRATVGKAQGPRRRLSIALAGLRSGKASPGHAEVPGVGKPKPGQGEAGRRSARRRIRLRNRLRTATRPALAALLVLCGTLLVGPGILTAIGTDASGTAEGTAAVQDSAGTRGQGRSDEPAQQRAATGSESEPGSRDDATLSAQMRQRLADADPVNALSALVAVRAMVLATGEAELLTHVNVKDSEAMAADRDLVAELQEHGHVFSGLSIRLREAGLTESVTVPEGAAAVTATAVLSGYTEMDRSGAAVREVAESTPQDLVFVLVREGEMWKIASVHNDDAV